MHPIDIGLLLLLGWGAYKGYKTGLVLVLINTLALVAAVVVGLKFLSEATLFLEDKVSGGKMALPIFAFLLLFGITFFSLRWFAGFASKSLKQSLLGPFDQAGGVLLGLFRMSFILSSVLFGIHFLGIKIGLPTQEKLVVLPALQKVGPLGFKILAPLLPFLKKIMDSI